LLSSTLLSNVASIVSPKYKTVTSLTKKDILLSTRGILGQTEFVSVSARKKVKAMNVIIRVQSDEITPEYLLYVMNSQSFKMQLHKLRKGTSIPTVTNNDLRSIRIPIIPILQQKKKTPSFMKLFSTYQKALKKHDSAKDELDAAKTKLIHFR
jgi:restriction endonuclease S subunit